MNFQDLLAKNGDLGGQNRGRGGAMLMQTSSFYFGITSVPILVQIDQECDGESAHRQINRYPDENRFYNFVPCCMGR